MITLSTQGSDVSWRIHAYPLLLVLCCIVYGEGHLRADELVTNSNGDVLTLEQLFDAWRTQQARRRAVTLTWKGSVTYGEGSLFIIDKSGAAGERPEDSRPLSPVPSEDITFTAQGVLDWEQSKGRYFLKSNVPKWDAERGRLVQQEHIYVRDGELCQQFLGVSSESPLQLRGYIGRCDRPGPPNTDEIPAIVASLFPLGADLSPLSAGEGWMLLENQVEIDGLPCLVIERRNSNFQRTRAHTEKSTLLYVDPTKEFAIVRREGFVGGTLRSQVDFAYAFTSQNQWLPDRYRIVLTNEESELIRQYEFDVVSCLLTEGFPEERFTITFPVDTWVENGTTGREWIVRPNGRIRPISPEEAVRLTHEELIRTDVESPAFRKSVAWLGAGVTILSIVVLIKWRKRR